MKIQLALTLVFAGLTSFTAPTFAQSPTGAAPRVSPIKLDSPNGRQLVGGCVRGDQKSCNALGELPELSKGGAGTEPPAMKICWIGKDKLEHCIHITITVGKPVS